MSKSQSPRRNVAFPADSGNIAIPSAALLRPGVQANDILRILALVTEIRRLDPILPTAQALADRIHATRLDRAHQIAHLLAEMAARIPPQGPATARKTRGPKADEAPLSTSSP